MTFKSFILAGVVSALSLPALAGEQTIAIMDAYARSGSKSGAAFFQIMNSGDADDRLVAVSSNAAARVELHTHLEDANGVMRMREVEDGFPVPAGGMHALARGGDHVMFMGLDAPFEEGSTVRVTLTFENAGDITVDIPVDNDRADAPTGHSGHGN